jgi:ATP-dependent Clp protease ATP-binding subunit ClpA
MMFNDEGDRFAKFTERARKVLSLAHEEAQRMNHRYIGSEHILLGILREGEGVGARVLQRLGVDLNKTREVVRRLSEQNEQELFGLTTEGKLIIELAVDEARLLNHHFIGTEHILLGLARASKSMALRVLQEMGIEAEKMKTETLQVLSQAKSSRISEITQRMERKMEDFWRKRHQPQRENRFDQFDEDARKVLALAQEEAQRFQHNYMGTEHLLLGLIRLEESTAMQVLKRLGIEPLKIRSAIEFIIGRGDRVVLGEMGLTPRSKKVIELAIDEAHQLDHELIGTEHLLLGLVREGEGIASGVLESMGVHLGQVRQVVLDVVGRGHPLVQLASAYVRGEKELEPRSSSIQDADDLVPEPASAEDRGNHFTLRMRRVLIRARAEAQHYQRERVGTDHLLLSLIREENGIAFHVLRNLGIESERIQTATDFLLTQEKLSEPGEGDAFTDDGRKALDLAIDEARRLNQVTIGTEHLLLGLVRSEGMASGILITRGLTLEKARAETSRLLGL